MHRRGVWGRGVAVFRFTASLVLMGLCGCFELAQEVWVNPDFSGRVRWEVSASDTLAGTARGDKPTPLGSLPDTFQRARRDLEALPYVEACEFRVLREAHGERYVLDVAVTDFRALDSRFGAVFQGTGLGATADGSNPFGELRLEERRGGKIVLVQTLVMEEDLSGTDEISTMLANSTGDDIAGALLGQVLGRAATETTFVNRSCTVTFHLPARVSTNGERQEDTRVAQWTLPMADLVRGKPDTRELRASFYLGTPWWMWVPLIGFGAVALGTGGRSVFMAMGTRAARRSPKSLSVECPHCGQHGNVSVAKAGAHLRCRHCGKTVDVPFIPIVEEPEGRPAWQTGLVSVGSALAAAGVAAYVLLPSQLPARVYTAANPPDPESSAASAPDLRTRLDAYRSGEYDSTWEAVRQQAAAGETGAQFVVSLMYGEGRGAPQDAIEWKRWLRVAGATGTDAIQALAAEGHVEAQYVLAGMHVLGYGVPASGPQAVALYRAAAAQGHAQAQLTLAEAYSEGRGVSQDADEAEKWLRAAADTGDESAQVRLDEITAQRKAEKAAQREQRKLERITRNARQQVADMAANHVAEIETLCAERIRSLQAETGTGTDPLKVERLVANVESTCASFIIKPMRERERKTQEQVEQAETPDDIDAAVEKFAQYLSNGRAWQPQMIRGEEVPVTRDQPAPGAGSAVGAAP